MTIAFYVIGVHGEINWKFELLVTNGTSLQHTHTHTHTHIILSILLLYIILFLANNLLHL